MVLFKKYMANTNINSHQSYLYNFRFHNTQIHENINIIFNQICEYRNFIPYDHKIIFFILRTTFIILKSITESGNNLLPVLPDKRVYQYLYGI